MSLSRLLAKHRQLLPRSLFLVAIIAPSILLVTLSLRLIAQDGELADKRARDSRTLATAGIAQRLTTRLEQLKLQALAAGATWNPGVHAIALVAKVDGERLILPWDDTAAQTRYSSEVGAEPFAAAIADAERHEYLVRERTPANAAYRAARAVARSPEQRAAAALGLLRTSSPGPEADRNASFLLQSPVVDEEGIPVSLYAVRVLLTRGAPGSVTSREVIGALRRALDGVPPLDLIGLNMVRELAEAPQLDRPELAEVRSGLQADAQMRLAAAQQAHELQASFAGLAARQADSDPAWFPFESDHDMWLVTVTRPPVTQDSVVVAIRADAVENADLQLSRRQDDAFEPLGAGYPGLSARLPKQPLTNDESVWMVLIGVVVLTLAIALSGSWFFWRDVQRDLRLAELRSQFVASVSHELKTPLTAIRMFAETLKLGRTPSERTAEYLDTIVSESERLTRLMNNVLDFSKVEQGTRSYRLTPQPVAPIVRSAARTLRYPLEQDAFELRLEIDDESLQARCDADALEQAILNLLSNAMKYSGASQLIELRLMPAEGAAAIVVKDRGLGIPAAEQLRVFEKFYRGAAEAHQRVAGTGLGLTLVQHTVRAHGGSVAIDSRPGEGSTFTILLPTIQPGDSTAPARASAVAVPTSSVVKS